MTPEEQLQKLESFPDWIGEMSVSEQGWETVFETYATTIVYAAIAPDGRWYAFYGSVPFGCDAYAGQEVTVEAAREVVAMRIEAMQDAINTV